MSSMGKTQDCSVIAVMGATGTGKSTFIKLLTNDEGIHIGHTPDSETSAVHVTQYTDKKARRDVTLVDTPGFDDSREGITDTDILEKIVRFLEPENGKKQALNGIIYMHRISDPRVGGLARKNIKMLQALCGDKNLDHVRIVTTNWARVTDEEGSRRQDSLVRGAFKDLIDNKAEIRRHSDSIESAQQILSELIPLSPVTIQIQEELRQGATIGDTSAGAILTAEMREMKKKT
ncbi:P-loop containing nucleoside triphosphate hydrolase protein [Chiua virens]|nr:P-loop containing nucleoside triphosphate hydrolase protein [Chiua virens]